MTKTQGWLLIAAVVIIGIVLIWQGAEAAFVADCATKSDWLYPECG